MSEGAYARSTDPTTASDAAETVSVAKAEMLVLERLRSKRLLERGATSDEMAKMTGIDRVTVSPRFRPLERKGLICDSGERRRGQSGRYSIVWKALDKKAQPSATVRPARRGAVA